MARSSTPGGIGYKDKNDLNDQVFKPADSEFVAVTVDAAMRRQSAALVEVEALIQSVLKMHGVDPGSVTDAAMAALLSQSTSASRKAVDAAVAAAKVSAFGVRVDAYGVVGDGVTDDTAAFQAAASAAATFGVPLVIPAGFSIGISSYKRLPVGLVMHTNGSTFQQLTAMGRAPVIGLAARSRVIGGLYVRTLGGAACQGVTISDSPGVSVDVVDVRSSVIAAGSGNVRDNGLRILNSDDVSIGRVFVENYDWPVWVEKSAKFNSSWVECKNYAKALHLDDVTRLRISGGHVYGTSPNTKYAPGYNGILMEGDEGTDDVRITGFTVEDAGEHGYRISGPAAHTDIWLGECLSRNVGGTGFKVLGSLYAAQVYNKRITLNACTAVDSGRVNQNTCGFLIQMAEDVRIIAPTVTREKKDYSGTEGIRMSGVKHVRISDAKILDTFQYAFRIDEALGNVQDVTVSNMQIQTPSGQGVYLQNPGVEFRDIRINAFIELYNSTGSGFYAGRFTNPEDSGTWRGMNELTGTISESTLNHFSDSTSPNAFASFLINMVARQQGKDIPFRNGSTLIDYGTNNKKLRRSGTWIIE